MSKEKRNSITAELPHLMRYARALKRDPDTANDLVQATVERALGHLHQFRSGTNMRAWLFTIMHNHHVQELRRLGRRLDTAPLDAVVENRHGTPASQEGHLAARDMARGLEALPEDQRAVILLICLEDMSYSQAAEILGVPIGTVMSRLARARERLRRFMEFGVPALRSVQ